MADLARGRLHAKVPQLEKSLTGQVGDLQRSLLAHIHFLDERIERVGFRQAQALGFTVARQTDQPAARPRRLFSHQPYIVGCEP